MSYNERVAVDGERVRGTPYVAGGRGRTGLLNMRKKHDHQDRVKIEECIYCSE